MKLATLLFLLLSAAPVVVSGTVYYVSPQGDDSLDGTSEKTAWKTVGKVNSAALAPGDTVKFQRGSVFREALKPTASGTAEAPLQFTSFGEGALPLFSGSDEVVVTGDRINFPRPVTAVLTDDGTFLRVTEDYRLENGTVILSKPRAAGSLLRVISRDDMIHLSHVNHIVVRGLAVDATAKMHAGYGFRIDGASHILLEDCEATRCGKHHFGVINSTAVTLRRCKASLVMPDQGRGGASAFVSYSDHKRKGDTSRYENCIVENYEDVGNGQYPAFVTHGEGIGSVEITGLTSKGAGVSFNNLESGSRLSLNDSQIEDAGVGLFGNSCTVSRVVVKRGILTLAGKDNRVSDCQFLDYNPGFLGHQSIVVSSGTGNLLEKCELRLSPEARPFNAAIALIAPEVSLTVKACKFGEHGAVVRTFFPDPKPGLFVEEDNLYPPDAKFVVKGREKSLSLSEWRGLTVR